MSHFIFVKSRIEDIICDKAANGQVVVHGFSLEDE